MVIVGRIVTPHGERWAAWTDRGLVAVGARRAEVVTTVHALGLRESDGPDGATVPTEVDWRAMPGGLPWEGAKGMHSHSGGSGGHVCRPRPRGGQPRRGARGGFGHGGQSGARDHPLPPGDSG